MKEAQAVGSSPQSGTSSSHFNSSALVVGQQRCQPARRTGRWRSRDYPSRPISREQLDAALGPIDAPLLDRGSARRCEPPRAAERSAAVPDRAKARAGRPRKRRCRESPLRAREARVRQPPDRPAGTQQGASSDRSAPGIRSNPRGPPRARPDPSHRTQSHETRRCCPSSAESCRCNRWSPSRDAA